MRRRRCAQPELRRRDWGVLGHRVGALGAMRGSEARLAECRCGYRGVTRHLVGTFGAGRAWSSVDVVTGASPHLLVGTPGAGRGGECARASNGEARCLTMLAADERAKEARCARDDWTARCRSWR